MQNTLHPDVEPYRHADHPVEPALLNRWSPRAFSSEPIPEEILMSVFEAARWAASSFNEQPWRFLIARTGADRKTFLEFLAPFNRTWAQAAPVLVLIVTKKTFSHDGTPNRVCEFDAGTCSGYMTLEATLKGLVSHGMAGFDRDKARELLHIPADFEPLAVYAIGKQGDKATLSPELQARETPSGRRPVAESIMEGGFRPDTEWKAEDDTETTK